MRVFLLIFMVMFISISDVGAFPLQRATATATITMTTGTTTETTTETITMTNGTISSTEETADQEVAWVMSHNAIIGIVVMSFVVFAMLFCFCLEFGLCAI